MWYHMCMNKTTVYLPEGLKRSLRRLAAASGRSEADLIREAIAARIQADAGPRPHGRLFESGDPSLAENAEEALAGFGDR
jgi:plasmid stability protein